MAGFEKDISSLDDDKKEKKSSNNNQNSIDMAQTQQKMEQIAKQEAQVRDNDQKEANDLLKKLEEGVPESQPGDSSEPTDPGEGSLENNPVDNPESNVINSSEPIDTGNGSNSGE